MSKKKEDQAVLTRLVSFLNKTLKTIINSETLERNYMYASDFLFGFISMPRGGKKIKKENTNINKHINKHITGAATISKRQSLYELFLEQEYQVSQNLLSLVESSLLLQILTKIPDRPDTSPTKLSLLYLLFQKCMQKQEIENIGGVKTFQPFLMHPDSKIAL